MSKTVVETKITPQYLRGKSKEQIIDIFMLFLKQQDEVLALLHDANRERKFLGIDDGPLYSLQLAVDRMEGR